MAAKPEVLIPSLLQMEKLFQSWNEATKLAALQDIDRQRATHAVSAQYPRRLATTGSGNNLAIAIVRNEKKQAQTYGPVGYTITYGLDRHVRHSDNA